MSVKSVVSTPKTWHPYVENYLKNVRSRNDLGLIESQLDVNFMQKRSKYLWKNIREYVGDPDLIHDIEGVQEIRAGFIHSGNFSVGERVIIKSISVIPSREEVILTLPSGIQIFDLNSLQLKKELNFDSDTFIVSQSGFVDSSLANKEICVIKYDSLVFINSQNLFLAWTRQGSDLFMIDPNSYKAISSFTKSQNCAIFEVIDNPSVNGVISIGVHNLDHFLMVETWDFRYQGKYLRLRGTKVLKPQLWLEPQLKPISTSNISLCDFSQKLLMGWKNGAYLLDISTNQNSQAEQSLIGRSNLHLVNTTGVLNHHQGSCTLITGASDGSIKSWNDKFCPLNTYIGHLSSITKLSTLITMPDAFVSTALDGSLRLWSTTCSQQIDRADVLKCGRRCYLPCDFLVPYHCKDEDQNDLSSVVVAHSISWQNGNIQKTIIQKWKFTKIYDEIMEFSHAITSIHLCSNEQSVLITTASRPPSVHLINTITHQRICSAIMEEVDDPLIKIIDAAWQWSRERLIIITSDGKLWLYSTECHPCRKEAVFNCDAAISAEIEGDSKISRFMMEENEGHRLSREAKFAGPVHIYEALDCLLIPHYRKLVPTSCEVIIIGLDDGSLVALDLEKDRAMITARVPCHIRNQQIDFFTTEYIDTARSATSSEITSTNVSSDLGILTKVENNRVINKIQSDIYQHRIYTTGSDSSIKVWSVKAVYQNPPNCDSTTEHGVITLEFNLCSHPKIFCSEPTVDLSLTYSRAGFSELLAEEGILFASVCEKNKQRTYYPLIAFQLDNGSRIDPENSEGEFKYLICFMLQGHSMQVTRITTNQMRTLNQLVEDKDPDMAKGLLIASVSELDQTGNIRIWKLQKSKAQSFLGSRPKSGAPMLKLRCISKIRMAPSFLLDSNRVEPKLGHVINSVREICFINKAGDLYACLNQKLCLFKREVTLRSQRIFLLEENTKKNLNIIHNPVKLVVSPKPESLLTTETLSENGKYAVTQKNVRTSIYDELSCYKNQINKEIDPRIANIYKRLQEREEHMSKLRDCLKYGLRPFVRDEIEVRKLNRLGSDWAERRSDLTNQQGFMSYLRIILKKHKLSKLLLDRIAPEKVEHESFFSEPKLKVFPLVTKHYEQMKDNIDQTLFIHQARLEYAQSFLNEYVQIKLNKAAEVKILRRLKRKAKIRKKRSKKLRGKRLKTLTGRLLLQQGLPAYPGFFYRNLEGTKFEKTFDSPRSNTSDLDVIKTEFYELPFERPGGFFVRNALKKAQISMCGWMPNSAAVQRRWSTVETIFKLNSSTEDITNWSGPNLASIKAKLDSMKPAELEPEKTSLESKDSSISESFLSKHSGGCLKKKLEVTSSNPLMQILDEKKHDQKVAIEVTPREKVNLISPKPIKNEKMISSPSVAFLTEVIQTPRVPSAKPFKKWEPKLPEFLEAYRNSNFLKLTDIMDEHRCPKDWIKSPAYHSPNDFLSYLLSTSKVFITIITPGQESYFEFLEALLKINDIYGLTLSIRNEVCNRILSIILDLFTSILKDNDIKELSKMFLSLDQRDIKFITFVLAGCFGSDESRDFAFDLLISSSLNDKFGELMKEIELWKTKLSFTYPNNSKESCLENMKGQLSQQNDFSVVYNFVFNWLKLWMETFEPNELVRSKQDQSALGKISKRQPSKAPGPSILRRSVKTIPNDRVKFAKNVQQVDILKADGYQDALINSPRFTAVDLLNRFCEWAHLKRLDELRKLAKEESNVRIKNAMSQHQPPVSQLPIIIESKEENTKSLVSPKLEIKKVKKETVSIPPISPSEKSIITTQKRVVEKWKENEEAINRITCFKDRTRPPFAQPWLSFRNTLLGEFSNFMHLHPSKVTLSPFSENKPDAQRMEVESFENEIRRRMQLLTAWFLPDASRPLPSMHDCNSNEILAIEYLEPNENAFLDLDELIGCNKPLPITHANIS